MSDEPRIGRTRNLAWGLVTLPLTVIVMLVTVVPAGRLVTAADRAGYMGAAAEWVPWAGPILPWETDEVALFGPWLAAAFLVGRGERWQTALLAGAISAILFTGLTVGSSGDSVRHALELGYVSVVAGLTAGVLCAVRRRWRC